MLLAVLLAIHNLIISLFTQGMGEAVNSLVVWGGALIIFSEQPPGWRPKPSRAGMVMATTLLLVVLWRCQQITSLDTTTKFLPLLAGMVLVLLASPAHKFRKYSSFVLVLSLPSLVWGLSSLISTEKLCLLTAWITQAVLAIFDLPAEVQGNVVRLPGGAVQIAGPCSGILMVMQLIIVGVIFALAFPMRHRWQNAVMLLVGPLLAILANGFRIALLAWITASTMQGKAWWFEFFHKNEGAQVFSGMAMLAFVWVYGLWMDWQVSRLEQTR